MLTNREVSVSKSDSRTSGSCNGCTDYTSVHGAELRTVYNINLRSTNVRVCPKCAKELLIALNYIIRR